MIPVSQFPSPSLDGATRTPLLDHVLPIIDRHLLLPRRSELFLLIDSTKQPAVTKVNDGREA